MHFLSHIYYDFNLQYTHGHLTADYTMLLRNNGVLHSYWNSPTVYIHVVSVLCFESLFLSPYARHAPNKKMP